MLCLKVHGIEFSSISMHRRYFTLQGRNQDPPRGGGGSLGAAPSYDFSKLHEIENILVRRGRRVCPLKSATALHNDSALSSNVFDYFKQLRNNSNIYFHRQPTDIKETVKYTQGLKLTESNSISTKTGISLELERSVSKGPISASVKTTLSFELNTVNTWGKESTWSREVT